jgi:hypothetical protein
MKNNKQDLFYKLINEGRLTQSSLNSDFNSVRTIEFREKTHKLTLEVL